MFTLALYKEMIQGYTESLAIGHTLNINVHIYFFLQSSMGIRSLKVGLTILYSLNSIV